MGGCPNSPEKGLSEDNSEVPLGGDGKNRKYGRLALGSQSSQFPRKNLWSSRVSGDARRQLVTIAHKKILAECRGFLDKLDQCDTRSMEWNNWIVEITNLLASIKLKNKARATSLHAKKILSSLLNDGSTEDKAIGSYFLKLTDNYSGPNSSFFSNWTHPVLGSQPSLFHNQKVADELGITEDLLGKNSTLAIENTCDSQIVTHSSSPGKVLQSIGRPQFPKAKLFPGLQNFLKWNFDLFAFSNETNGRPLSTMFLWRCSQTKAGTAIEGINVAELSNYIFEVESQYGNNPYHNFEHAADVLHSCINLMETEYLKKWLDHTHRFALAFAAAVHDFRHPGVGNDFLVNINHEIATTYNDTSVLENWHTSQAFLLLKKPNLNFLDKVETTIKSLIRQRVIYAILMTDMQRHKEHVEELQDFLDNRETSSEIIDPGRLMSYCLHVSDLSHPTKEFGLHQKWSSRITKEFLLQGDRELDLGMEPEALYDRRNLNLEKSQIGFIDFVVLPLWVNWTTLIGEKEELIDQIYSNKDEWLRLLNLKEQEAQFSSFDEFAAQDIGQVKTVWSRGTNDDQSQDEREHRQNKSRQTPTPHADEVSITSPRKTIEQKIKPDLDEQHNMASGLVQLNELNQASLSKQLVVLPQEPTTEDKVLAVSGSTLRDCSPSDLQYTGSGDGQSLDKETSVISAPSDLQHKARANRHDSDKEL